MSIDAKAKKALEEPFPPEKIRKKGGGSGPRGRPPLPYISHGLVTERLCDVDPDWSSQHLETHTYTDREGNLHCAGVTIALTVKGVTRVESGGPERSERFALEIKNAMSDALKRAAMRFGVALSMWEDLVDAEGDEDYANRPANAQNGPSEPRNAPQAQRQPNAPPRPAQAAPANAQVSPSERQRREQLRNLSMAAKEAGIDGADLDRLSMEQFHVMAVSLEMQQAIDLIGMIESGVRPSGWKDPNDTPERLRLGGRRG